jgi:hypothetical protein
VGREDEEGDTQKPEVAAGRGMERLRHSAGRWVTLKGGGATSAPRESSKSDTDAAAIAATAAAAAEAGGHRDTDEETAGGGGEGGTSLPRIQVWGLGNEHSPPPRFAQSATHSPTAIRSNSYSLPICPNGVHRGGGALEVFKSDCISPVFGSNGTNSEVVSPVLSSSCWEEGDGVQVEAKRVQLEAKTTAMGTGASAEAQEQAQAGDGARGSGGVGWAEEVSQRGGGGGQVGVAEVRAEGGRQGGKRGVDFDLFYHKRSLLSNTSHDLHQDFEMPAIPASPCSQPVTPHLGHSTQHWGEGGGDASHSSPKGWSKADIHPPAGGMHDFPPVPPIVACPFVDVSADTTARERANGAAKGVSRSEEDGVGGEQDFLSTRRDKASVGSDQAGDTARKSEGGVGVVVPMPGTEGTYGLRKAENKGADTRGNGTGGGEVGGAVGAGGDSEVRRVGRGRRGERGAKGVEGGQGYWRGDVELREASSTKASRLKLITSAPARQRAEKERELHRMAENIAKNLLSKGINVCVFALAYAVRSPACLMCDKHTHTHTHGSDVLQKFYGVFLKFLTQHELLKIAGMQTKTLSAASAAIIVQEANLCRNAK